MCATRDTLRNWACQKGHPVLEVAVEMSGTRVGLYLPESGEPLNHFTNYFRLNEINRIKDLLNKSEKLNNSSFYHQRNIETDRQECVAYLYDVTELLETQIVPPLIRKTLKERLSMLENLDAYDSRMGQALNKNYAEELFSLLLLASATQFYTQVLYNLLQQSPGFRKYKNVAIFTKNKILWGLPLFILLERPTYYLIESIMRPPLQNHQGISHLLVCQGEDRSPFTDECRAILNQVQQINQCRLYKASDFDEAQFRSMLQEYRYVHFSGHSDGHSLKIQGSQTQRFDDVPSPTQGRFCFLACCSGVKNTIDPNSPSIGERFLDAGIDILIAGYWLLPNDPMKTFSPLFYSHMGSLTGISAERVCKALHDARDEYNNRRRFTGFCRKVKGFLVRKMPNPISLWNWGTLQVFVPIRCTVNNCVRDADNVCAT